jgi:hypothetical protein
MKLVKEPKAKISVLGNNVFQHETAPHLPSLVGCFIAVGARGRGKSVALTNLLRMYKQTGSLQRLLVISPSFQSNVRLMLDLDVRPEDVFDDPDQAGLIEKVIQIVEEERDEFERYMRLKENYAKMMEQMKRGYVPDEVQLMEYFNPATNDFQMPKPRYECYLKGKPPHIALFCDDIMMSKTITDKALPKMMLRHRHLGALSGSKGGALGLSLFFAIQSWKAKSGMPRSIRNNSSAICIFKTRDAEEIKEIQQSWSGEVDGETFLKFYDIATKDNPHGFLFIDSKPKPNQPSGFRSGFDTYLVPDSVK